MIENINEGTLRIAARVGPSDAIHDKEIKQQKAEEARQARPVEKSGNGAQAAAKDEKDKGSAKYLVNDNEVVFEKYDAKGELVLRIPPSTKPVNQRV